MSKHLVDMASKQKDVMFNMLSIKHKLLIPGEECEKCKQHSKDWLIISVCHHVLCINCAKIEGTGTISCQICNTMFDPNTQVSTVTEMKIAFSQIEDLVWKVIALESGTLDELYPDEEFNKKIKPDMIHINSIKSSIQNYSSNQNAESNEESNLNLSQSSVDLFEETEDIDIPEEENYNNRSNESVSICVNSDRNDKLAARVPDIVAEWDTDTDSDAGTKLCDSQNKDSTVIVAAVDSQLKDQSMSGKPEDKCREKNTMDPTNSVGESDEDVVNGTPDRCHVSNPGNHSLKNGNIVISYTNVEDGELKILQELVDVFELDARVSWSDSVTHLIVKTLPTGRCIRTKKFMNALLLNCFIITLEWAKNCLASKTLLPEVDYIPLEYSGEPSPLVSWRVGRGIIDSPMEWTRDCILYLHSSIEFNDSHNDIIIWARRAGFVLTNDLGEFKDHYKMRVILADKIFTSNDARSKLPNKTEITSWICDYKAVTIFLDWFLECLFQYRFIVVSQYHQIMKLNPNIVEFTNMDESMFQYET